MRELLKKLVGIEPMAKDEKEDVLLGLLMCVFMFVMIYLALILG